jgi:hypothetical protein
MPPLTQVVPVDFVAAAVSIAVGVAAAMVVVAVVVVLAVEEHHDLASPAQRAVVLAAAAQLGDLPHAHDARAPGLVARQLPVASGGAWL